MVGKCRKYRWFIFMSACDLYSQVKIKTMSVEQASFYL